MGRTLYLECSAGISGDMTVAMLLDLGASEEVMMKALDSIPRDSFRIETGRTMKAGIDCCDFNVMLDQEHENHDHDMEYLHGHEHAYHHAHEQDHDHEQEHLEHDHHDHKLDHDHEQEHHEHGHEHDHHHEHTTLTEINEIISACDMTAGAKDIAYKIFDIIADAEGKAHNKPKDQVHFHEVGAIDSIVDIIAAAVCFDDLQITDVIVPRLSEGTGTVRCQHGILPVPVPAVAHIVSAYDIRLHIMDVQGEFVTPTGAAIVAAMKTCDTLPETFAIERTGMGAGKRDYKVPSILRGMLIHETTDSPGDVASDCQGDVIYKLESNIDDATGENLGYVMGKLFQAGARDVHFHPVYMKKNRPGWQLNVICDKADIDVMERIIFETTTTIGIRIQEMKRATLPREIIKVDTPYGTAAVKVVDVYGKRRVYPEYDDVAEMADRTGLGFAECMDIIKSEANR